MGAYQPDCNDRVWPKGPAGPSGFTLTGATHAVNVIKSASARAGTRSRGARIAEELVLGRTKCATRTHGSTVERRYADDQTGFDSSPSGAFDFLFGPCR